MSIRYVVSKRVFGFDERKQKSLLQSRVLLEWLSLMNYVKRWQKWDWCQEVQWNLCWMHWLILWNWILTRILCAIRRFWLFRPGIQAKSQDKLEDVTASTPCRKIIFTPGTIFLDMLKSASLTRMASGNTAISGGTKSPDPDEGGGRRHRRWSVRINSIELFAWILDFAFWMLYLYKQ